MAKKYKDCLGDTPYKTQREILQAIIKKITINGKHIKLELRVPKSVETELAQSEHLYGATVGNRTRDLILTMDALYRLSYCGTLKLLRGDCRV